MAASDSVRVIQGKKTDSGTDKVYDPDNEVHSDKMVSRKWIMVAGVKLLAIPNKLYDSNRGDFLVIGYHQKGNKILAWWNHSKKEGSNISLLHLLFNSYIIAGLICVGIPLWFVWKTEHFSQQQMNYIQIGSIAGIVLCYIFGYFEWKKKRLAQTLVNEQKSKLN